MRGIVRWLIPVEAIVCFGPLLCLLLLGVLVSPVWVMGLARDDPESVWAQTYPLVLIACGLAGTVALIRVVVAIVAKRSSVGHLTRWSAGAGIGAVLLFNLPWIPTFLAGEATLDAAWPILFYFLLPVGSAAHLLYLVSRKPVPRDVR